MRNMYVPYYVGVIIGAAAVGIMWWASTEPVPEEKSCADLRSEIWAFQQCLKFKPSCQVGGPDSFARYHKIKDLVAEGCPESADDYLSETK